ncbi:hypothetical protein CRUP_032044, partial [Coryphaenoides rupestris]
IDHHCPRGWWGSPICGPCHCDIAKGFDSDCNKTSGVCHCKEFHYWPRGSDSCLPCDCYPVGSFSRSCDQETGQCQCRPGVIGRQCNLCDNPFAELELLERNETELSTIVEKKLAHQLRDVTEATARLYGNDLQIAERLLSRLLAFETQQTGFGLTATQDAHFNETQNHVPAGGPGGLAELLEQYAQTLAQNMKLTYLNPVALVAPN